MPVLASIATILSLTLVPLLYFLNWFDERTRISRNLYGELKDTLDTLESRKHPGYPVMKVEVETDDGQKHTHTYTNRFFNHDVYDSLVSSGKINFLKYELQQIVQNIFKMIKQHNEYLSTIMDVCDHASSKTSLASYYAIMDEYEQDLMGQIPNILIKLEKEFPRITSRNRGAA